MGFGGIFHRSDKHPLDPDSFKERKESIATTYAIKTGENIPVDSVVFLSILELPKDVAKARWPEDFK